MARSKGLDKRRGFSLDGAWTLYFIFSYALYLITPYSHYISTLFVLLITFLKCRTDTFRVSKDNCRILAYCGIFYIWILASYLWADWKNDGQKTIIISSVEILVMLFCMMFYVKNRKRLLKLIDSFIKATLVCALLYYATSPVSTWGTTGMGLRLSMWRNAAGYYFMFAAVFSLYMNLQFLKQRKYMFIFVILAIAAIGTGSRKVFVQFAISAGIYLLTERKLGNKLKYACIGLCAAVLVFAVGSRIPAFRSIYEGRLMSIFLGAESGDASAITRMLFRSKAIDLFYTSPWVGRGLNAFTGYVGMDTAFLDRWAISATYSHCNYTELLANNGLIGFALYYTYPVKRVINNFKKRNEVYKRLGLIVIITFLILDYATISYYMRMYLVVLAIAMLLLSKSKENAE